MSLRRVVDLAESLPANLRDQVISYAESVDRAMPDIFREVGRRFDAEKANEVVFLAGLRKLYGVVTSTYWTLENSIETIGRSDLHLIRIGGTAYSRTSVEYRQIRALVDALEREAGELSIREQIEESPKDALLRTYRL